MMKKFALRSLALLLTFAAACSDYDDTDLWNSVNDIKKRVEALETAVAKLNSDVSAMQTLIEKLNEKVYVSKVETNADGSYTIYFTDPENTKITITDGKDGAAAPVIGVAKDTDEVYYWTLTSGGGEPEWLLADGKKIPVTAAAVVPLLKIDDKGFWIISCDKGTTWNYITDDKDQPVSALGQGGVSDSFFKEVTQDGAYAYFTLMDGTTITVAMRSDFYLLVKMAPALGTYAYGETKTYETESVGVNDVVLTKPTGWTVSYADEVLTIKAPAEEAVCETEGEIAVIYFGDNDRSSLVKMKVKIDKDYTGVTEGDNFTLEITEVGDTRVSAAITPKDPEMSYYVYPYDPDKSDEACITQLQKRFKADIADGPEYVDYFFKGAKTDYKYSGLTPGESYDLSVVGVKYDLTAKTLDIVTPLMRVPFSTKAPEIINTTYLMTLSDISWYGAKCAVHPSDDLPYFCTFVKKSTFDMAYDDADFAQTYIDDRYLWPYYGELSEGTLLWSDFTATGDIAFSSPGFVRRDPLYISEDIFPLESDTDYYAVAFGCNEDGEFSNSRVSRKLFRTKAFTPTEACTFTIDVTVDKQDLAIKVTPSDKNTSYITFIDERDTYRDNFATPRQYPPYDLYWRMQGLEAGQTIGDDDCFYTGDAAYNVVSLKAASAYIVFAYGCSADGRITTEPEIVEVHTKGTVDQPDLNSAAKQRRTGSPRTAYRVIR